MTAHISNIPNPERISDELALFVLKMRAEGIPSRQIAATVGWHQSYCRVLAARIADDDIAACRGRERTQARKFWGRT